MQQRLSDMHRFVLETDEFLKTANFELHGKTSDWVPVAGMRRAPGITVAFLPYSGGCNGNSLTQR